MASTGSNLEAETAGMRPEMIPIKTETHKPVTIFLVDKETSKSK